MGYVEDRGTIVMQPSEKVEVEHLISLKAQQYSGYLGWGYVDAPTILLWTEFWH